MKKISAIFALFTVLIFVVSCGSSSTNDDNTDTGETVTDGDTVDADPESDSDPSGGDTEPTENPDSDNPDTTPDGGDSQPDESDTAPDGDDTLPEPDEDNGDFQPDEGETEPDNDYPQAPCDPNPCTNIGETGICVEKNVNEYSCECEDNYFWNSDLNECMKNPCFQNSCNIPNSTGICNPVTETLYVCECENNYYWWENEKGCLDKRPLSLGGICTGQTLCYGNSGTMTCPTSSGVDFFGQDAQYTSKCNAQSFSSGTGAQAGTVTDNNTGLTWEQSPSESTYTWDKAPNHCADLNSSNYGGRSNWRVPNPLEFLTIVDNSTYDPATNSNFTNMPTDSNVWFWTSKRYIYKYDMIYAYAFMPYIGSYYADPSSLFLQTNTYKVLCVSGDEMQPATSADFTTQTINGSVVVTDSKTGLMWQKECATGKTWQQALKYCEDSTYADYSDWRLPNKNELASLLDSGKSGTPDSNFPDMPRNYFWSSSTNAFNTDFAWYVDFTDGYLGNLNKPSFEHVRCVRNAE